MEPASSRWLHGSSRPKWHPEGPQKTPAGHGATKPSVAPCVVKTKMAPPKPGKDTMEPPRPLWLHGSPGAKWHPKDSEDVNPEQLEQGWMKALRRLSIWDCSLRLMWTWNSQVASKRLKSYAITMYGRPIRYRRKDNHPFQVQPDIPTF